MEPLTRGVIPLLAVLLAGCMVPIGVPQPGGATSPPVDSSTERAGDCVATAGHLVLERVNGIRSEHGLGPLSAEARLVEAAVSHTQDQARHGTTSHTGSDGSGVGDRVTAAGYGWSLVAENVGAGQTSADAIVRAWMNSPGHRAVILSPDAVHAGIAYVQDPGGMRHYWTLVVARPLTRPGPAEPDPDSFAPRVLACHP